MRTAFTLLAAVWLGATNVTGTWSATAESRFPSGKIETHAMVFVFKQDSSSLTGSVGPDAAHQFPIDNGLVVNDSLKFDCKWGNGALLHFALTVRGDSIEGRADGDAKQMPANPGSNFTNTVYLRLKRADKESAPRKSSPPRAAG